MKGLQYLHNRSDLLRQLYGLHIVINLNEVGEYIFSVEYVSAPNQSIGSTQTFEDYHSCFNEAVGFCLNELNDRKK